MKERIILWLALIAPFAVFGQQGRMAEQFVLSSQFLGNSPVNDSTYQVTISHPFSQINVGYLPNQIQVGFIAVDPTGRRYRVASIVSTALNSSVLNLVELQDDGPPSGAGIIYEKPPNGDFILQEVILERISPAFQAMINNHNSINSGGSGSGGGTVNGVVAGDNVSVDISNPDNPVVSVPSIPNEDVVIADPGGYFVATDLQGMIQEGAVNTIAVDLIAGDLVDQTGMPVSSRDYGVFTDDVLSDNATAKTLFQELGTEADRIRDSVTVLRSSIPTATSDLANDSGFLTAEVDGSTTNEIQDISTNDTPGNITLSDGSTLTLNVEDDDADATNEIQAISIDSSGTSFTITLSDGGGSVTFEAEPDKFENVRSLNIATPLLDEHPIRRRGGMFFSVYRVNSNYRGPAFDMRNSEGDTASIPYLSNGYIDADSIASFANGNVSHLVTWYDQSVNGYHAYAVDISTAPELTNSSGILHVNAEGVFGPNFSFGDYLEGSHRMKGNEASLFFVGQEYASGSSTSVAWFSADIANVNGGIMFGASWTVDASIGLLNGTDNLVATRSHNFQQDTTVFHLMTNTPTLKNWFVGGQMQELDTIALSYSDAIDWGTRFNIGIAYSGASSLYRQYAGVINEVGVFNYDLAKNASDLAGNVNSRFSIEASNLEYVIDTVITLPSVLEKEFVVQSPRGTTNLTFIYSEGIYDRGVIKDTVRFNHVTAEYIRFRVDTIGSIVTWNLLEGPATQESPASFNDIVIHEGVLNFDEIPEYISNGKTQGELLQEVIQYLGDTERGNVIYLSDLYLGPNDTTIILTDNIVIRSTYQGAPTQDDQKANITLDFNDPNMDGFFIIPDTVNNLVEPRGASFKNLRFEVLSPMRKVIDMGNTIGSIVSDCEIYLNDNAGVGIRMGAENWPGSADPLSPLSNRIDRVRIFDATDAAALVQGGTLNYFTETQLHRSATGIRVEGGTVYMNECWVEKSEGLALDIEQARIFSFQNGYLENQNTAAVDTVAMRLNNTDIFIFSGNTYSSAGTTMDAVFELEDVKHFEYSNNWISGAGVSNEIIDRSPEITCLNKFGNDYFSPGFTPVEPTICEPDLVDATLTRPVSNDATITNVDLKGTLNFTNIQLDGFKNLVANSEDVQTSSPSYTISATRLAVLVNDRANPLSGEITAERLTLTASTSAKLIEIFTSEPMVVGDRYNLTFYYEPGTEAFNDNITIEQNTFSNPEDFNLDSGLKQFQKISYTFTATNTASIQLRVRGDTDDYFWLTNVQITAGESSRDYVQTTGVSVKSNPKLTVDSEVSLLIDGDLIADGDMSVTGTLTAPNIMSSFTAAADTGASAEISDSETLTIAGGEGIDTEITGNTITTTLDLSELSVETSLGGNEFFSFYDSGNTSQWLAHIDTLLSYFENNAVIRSIYNPSGLLPDFGTYVNSDGAGFEITADVIDIQGVDVTVNGTPISIRTQDTLFIPIYAHPHDEAITTGSADYRGWRVPADLNGAKIEAIQYSFDTPGSDTVTIQLTNGTINIAGSTIPIAGYVENTAVSQTLTTGEKWTPTIGTINGTGHEGLMVNLMIVR